MALMRTPIVMDKCCLTSAISCNLVFQDCMTVTLCHTVKMILIKDIIFECGIFHCKSCLLIRLLAKQPHSIGKSIYLFILWMQYEIGYWARTWNCSPELESEQKYLTTHGIFQSQCWPWNHILKSLQQNKKLQVIAWKKIFSSHSS